MAFATEKSLKITLFRLITGLAFFVVVSSTVEGENISFMSIPGDKNIVLAPGKEAVVCSRGNEYLKPEKWFNQITYTVSSDVALGLHNVRGVSVDDFHAHAQVLTAKLLNHEFSSPIDSFRADTSKLPSLKDTDNIIRDLTSACPSLWSINRNTCSIGFSTIGTSCLVIKPNSKSNISIRVNEDFNGRFILSLGLGVLLIFASHEMSKSKIFQYLFGSAAFVVAGFLLLALYIISRFSKKSNQIGYLSILSLSVTYGASLIWLVIGKLKVILINYGEFFLGYILLMAIVGLISTRLLRRTETLKHIYRVNVKWFLRVIGLFSLYNSTASPLASLWSISLFLAIFLVYKICKIAGSKKSKLKK